MSAVLTLLSDIFGLTGDDYLKLLSLEISICKFGMFFISKANSSFYSTLGSEPYLSTIFLANVLSNLTLALSFRSVNFDTLALE